MSFPRNSGELSSMSNEPATLRSPTQRFDQLSYVDAYKTQRIRNTWKSTGNELMNFSEVCFGYLKVDTFLKSFKN